jgi:aminomethyltransferase
MADTTTEALRRTALHPLHVEYGAKLVPFAGYEMPVQFPDGVKEEHLWTRSEAGLFDVSHMGPCFLTLASGMRRDAAAHEEIAALIETLVASDIRGLKPGQARLTVLLNAEGGILDDLIITRPYEEDRQGELYIVVNGAMKEQDWGIFESALAGKAVLTRADDGVLLALQGPKAEKVLSAHFPQCAALKFMECRRLELNGETFVVSRCGYTGEDGFEVWGRASEGAELAALLLHDPCVRPIGLGARDSLRLEAGLCLYGHDLAPDISPVEADLSWVIQGRRSVRFPRRRAYPPRAEGRPRPQARRHPPAGAGAGARGHRDFRGRRGGGRGDVRRLRAEHRRARDDGLCGRRPCGARHED